MFNLNKVPNLEEVPYSNCGVGVYTITSPKELQDFMNVSHVYDKFVVQGLISHEAWPIGNKAGQLHHVGCRPRCDPDNKYVNDLRFMICAGPNGFMPVALYSRRSAAPLKAEPSYPSWEMLGTNLSLGEDGTSGTDTTRLLLLDKDTYSDLNLGLDELIESYVQTILAATAVEDLCRRKLIVKFQLSVNGAEEVKFLEVVLKPPPGSLSSHCIATTTVPLTVHRDWDEVGNFQLDP
uniref:Uncharacterized protein n=1 Tax=Romanomermis culicivorax TaxID=13658 RepID=A0A915J8J2_ROMCU